MSKAPTPAQRRFLEAVGRGGVSVSTGPGAQITGAGKGASFSTAFACSQRGWTAETKASALGWFDLDLTDTGRLALQGAQDDQ